MAASRLDPEPLVRLERYDVGGFDNDDRARRIVGVDAVADRPLTVWFSARMTAVQAAVDAALPGQRTFHWAAARDGLALPLVVTHPPGSSPEQPLPAVLLVHGGPWLHAADRRWSADAQFLASRGWRVIEPDFRGSTGYGQRHFRAGFKQWALAMQSAARRAGAAVERIDYNDQGHGFHDPKRSADVLRRLDRFLVRSLGRPALPE